MLFFASTECRIFANIFPIIRAMAEYGCYRAGSPLPLPDDVSLETGAFLEPASIAGSCRRNARMKIGDTVLITGGGSIGLLDHGNRIKKRRLKKLLVSDPIAEKRKLAKQLGADAPSSTR